MDLELADWLVTSLPTPPWILAERPFEHRRGLMSAILILFEKLFFTYLCLIRDWAGHVRECSGAVITLTRFACSDCRIVNVFSDKA